MLISLLLIAQAIGKDFITQAEEIDERKHQARIACDGMIFHGVYYNREILFKNLGRPYNIVLHKFSGLLFFSHTVENSSHVDFSITYCHITRKNCTDVKGVPGGYAIAYDFGNDDLYFGGHDGIYKYNFFTNEAEFFTAKDKSIWGLFVKQHFYYIEYPSQTLFVYRDYGFVKVAEAENIEIDNFFISKHNNIYFSNKTALYKVEKNSKDVIHLDDEIIVRQIVEDSYGDVYFVASDGIYLEDKPYNRVKKIAVIDQAFALTFDQNDRAIYSDKEAIYRLHPSPYSNLCYDALTVPKESDKYAPVAANSLKFAKAFLRSGFF